MELAINGGSPVRESLLGYGQQFISEGDVRAVVDVLQSDYLTCGPMVTRFERLLMRISGAAHMTAVSNGTAALHVACLAAGIKPGDEVIVSPITFAASANCVLYCGATPAFADIDPRSWNIDPKKVQEKITPQTKAIIAVDFGGVPVDADALRSICDEHGLVFIEDAAHSLGSAYEGRPVGSLADMTTFSFHPVKTITTAEGGAIASLSADLAQRIELFSKHGITRDESLMERDPDGGWYYEQLELGYNYRMSDMQAALGVSQLARLPEFAARRRRIVQRYNEAFDSVPEVQFQFDPAPDGTVRHLYCLEFDTNALGASRRFIFDALRAEGIGVNVHYLPVFRLPYYEHLGYVRGQCPNANRYYERAITLPLHFRMTDADVDDVITAVGKVVSFCRSSKTVV